jgi:hypothetical protein
MAQPVSVEELAEAIHKMVQDATGVKKFSAVDLTKAMIERFGAERCSKAACKEALRKLVDSGRCIYTSWGGASYVELPKKEGEAA